jgi:hypothetical protein
MPQLLLKSVGKPASVVEWDEGRAGAHWVRWSDLNRYSHNAHDVTYSSNYPAYLLLFAEDDGGMRIEGRNEDCGRIEGRNED